jgi:uncharacterized protein (TIGR03437 family)
MNRLLLAIVGLATTQAQILVDTVAGGKIRDGVPVQDVALSVGSANWGAGGEILFSDSSHDLIRRIRADGIVETIAGTGVTGFAGDGGPATSALLHGAGLPQYDAAGNLYFIDGGNSRIRRVDTHGLITTIAGDGISYNDGMDLEGPALLRSVSPGRLAVDPNGIVYFTEMFKNVVRRVSKTGQLEIFAGMYDPACNLCSDGDGSQAKAAHLDRPNGVITRFAGDRSFLNIRGPQDGGPALEEYLGFISGLAADGNGNIYVAHHRARGPFDDGSFVRRIDSNGIISTVVKGQYGILAADASGKLMVGNFSGLFLVSNDGTISKIAPGTPKPAPDGTPVREAWLLNPGPIALNRAGELYVGEQQPCVIRKITSGVLTTFATGKCPSSMAFDSQDRLWVVSAGIVYVIAPDGSISTPTIPPTIGPNLQIAFDAKDRLYLLAMFSLTRMSPDGSVQAILALPSAPGVPPPGLSYLSRLGADPARNGYFSSDGTQSVYRVNDDGSYSVVYKNTARVAIDAAETAWSGNSFTNASGSFSLGRLDAGYSGDGGPAQSARFYLPGGNTFTPNGDMYFVDGERIRKFTGIQPETPPVISAGGIVNSASYSGGFISPGELVSIFGSNFGASGLVMATFENNLVPFQLGRTKLLFDDQLGEIVAMTPNLINVLVPYPATPGTSVQVRVQVDASVSAPVTMLVVATVPDLYTADASGSGQGIFINEDGSINSSKHPSPHGSVVTIYGTGEGFLSPRLPKGALVISTPYPRMATTPTVTIAGEPAEVLSAGAAPFFPLGVFEIDVRIPSGIPVGSARVSVTMGDRGTTRIVTVAVE